MYIYTKYRFMKFLLPIFLLLSFSNIKAQADSTFIRYIYDLALENGEAYENLRSLCKDIGARVTGSAEAEMAVKWGEKLLKSYNFDKVYLQEIQVPHWERGTTEAAWIENEKGDILKLNILALGGSIGTNGLISGEVIEVKNVDALKLLNPNEIKDKIVFLSEAFNQKHINTFSAYGYCYPLRGDGANEASKLGAKAVVIRSLATPTDNHPHTGVTHFDKDVNKIPAAAMSTQNADMVSKWIKQGKVTLKMEMDCKVFPDVTSYNVIAEITGKDKKIITLGGHLDSWDVGEGAHDDGAGIVHSIEALRILKTLNYKPNHTIRCVLFMNEENGNFGGKSYAKLAKEANEEHICAIESDRGGFLPIGFDVVENTNHLELVKQYENLLFDYDLLKFKNGHGGVDIGPLKEYYPEMMQLGMAINSQEYFNYHHSEADVFEVVNKRELELGAAAMSTMVYLMDITLD
ncbi:M20/M25/M40 family metallo-hydrolase [Vicingus serpentipes]|uniref:Carboxypeptidase Q n=2 Tax=Vicingus serpentipes TaxID=1926625 RepID=A0A5C6RXS4_9FLAO|nr:M20/M25/M40 family metallo-hydrolase [Vicingus serpentipes]